MAISKAYRKILLIAALGMTIAAPSFAATCTSLSSGNWNVNGRWSCGAVPTNSDTVVIASGHTVTLNTNSAAIDALTINANATLNDSGTRTLNLDGNLTVNGSLNFTNSSISLSRDSVWGGSATGTAITAVSIAIGNRDLTFASSTVAYTISLTGATPLTLSGGSFNNNAANRLVTVQMSGANQSWTIFNTQYPQLQLSGSGTKTYGASAITVLGSITVDTGVTFNVTAATSTNNIGGNLTNNGTFSAPTGSGTWNFNGTSLQTITGGVTLYRMTVANTNGVALSSGDLAIGNGSSGGLNLSTGNVHTGSNKVTISTTCDNNLISGTGWINGNLQLTFPGFSATCTFRVGDSAYVAPVVLNIPYSGSIGTLAGLTLTASTTGSEHPNIATSGLNASRSVNRYWTLGSAGDTFGCVPLGSDAFNQGRYTATFQFPAANIDAGSNTSAFKINRYFGDWSTPDASATTGTSTSIQVNASSGTAAFGSYAIGEVSGSPSGNGVSSACSAVTALADYRMDESSWTGVSGEVKDSSGNNYNGTAARANGATPLPTTNSGSPAFTSSGQNTCAYGSFDTTSSPVRTYSYVNVNALPSLPSKHTIGAWIRSTNVGRSGQRIIVRDDADNGWAMSLGDGGSGRLRLFNRGATHSGGVTGDGINGGCGVYCMDTSAVITNNNWFYVAAVIDTVARSATLYVFNSTGTRIARAVGAYSGTWNSGTGITAIGGETASSPEGVGTDFHFLGNIDELQIYPTTFTESQLSSLLTRTRSCSNVNHVEFVHDATGHTCAAEAVTVLGCTTSSTCYNNTATQTSSTFTINPTAISGATWCQDAACATAITGSISVSNGQVIYLRKTATGSVTLAGTSSASSSAIQCYNTSNAGSGCGMDFYDAGFIFTNSTSETTPAPATAYNIANQIAGVSSATTYLRAVRTNAHTKACEAALQGNTAVELAYECSSDPSTCHAANLMSITGGTPSATTTITRNNNGSISSYQSVNLTFDANGNAPFTFSYADVGLVRLWARKTASGTLNTTLTGSSNVVTVKPYSFSVDSITCGATANPGAANSSGAKFCAAGSPFSATVSARAGGTNPITPSFGRCNGSGGTACTAAVATVSLDHTLTAPAGANAGTLNGTKTATGSEFSNGSKTFSNLSWSEVGIINIRATNGNYLSNNLALCAASPSPGDSCRDTFGDSGNVGRFYPSYFRLELTPTTGCTGFVYGGRNAGTPGVITGQPFTVRAEARNAYTMSGPTDTSTITTNYYYHVSDTTKRFAKAIDLSLAAGGGVGGLYVGNTAGGTGAIPAANFTAGVGSVAFDASSGRVSYAFTNSPTAHTTLTLHADDADSATSANTGDASIQARFGRMRLFNAFGTGAINLQMPVQTQYWTGNAWVISNGDSCSLNTVVENNFYRSSAISNIVGVALNNGQGTLTLSAPAAGVTGSIDIAPNLGAAAVDQSCLAAHGGNAIARPWLRAQNGNCVASATWSSDPSARATFGVPADSRRIIHVRD